jgi:hypothetical protein
VYVTVNYCETCKIQFFLHFGYCPLDGIANWAFHWVISIKYWFSPVAVKWSNVGDGDDGGNDDDNNDNNNNNDDDDDDIDDDDNDNDDDNEEDGNNDDDLDDKNNDEHDDRKVKNMKNGAI